MKFPQKSQQLNVSLLSMFQNSVSHIRCSVSTVKRSGVLLCMVDIWFSSMFIDISLDNVNESYLRFKLHWFKTVPIGYSMLYEYISLNNKDVWNMRTCCKVMTVMEKVSSLVHWLASDPSLWLLSKTNLCLQHNS